MTTMEFDRLKSDGFQLCLITNGEGAVQREKVRRFDLGHRFHHIQIEGERRVRPHRVAHDQRLVDADGPDERGKVGCHRRA